MDTQNKFETLDFLFLFLITPKNVD